MIIDQINLNSFLKLGYFIDYRNNTYQLDYSRIDRKMFHQWPEEDLINKAITTFRDAIEREFESNQDHVIPLSGGLDSRALLAGLFEFTPAAKIHTYTFGTPGTFDYEIGNKVAKQVGTDHARFPLTEYHYRIEELLDISRRIDHQTILFHHPPIWEIDKRFGNCLFWSGYIGDVITGGHLKQKPSTNITEAKQGYLQKYAYVTSLDLANCNDYEFHNKIDFQWLDPGILSFDEQMFYQERVQKLTAPHVLMHGYNYKTPFINNAFMDFMFSIADKYRKDQYLYKKMLLRAYPRFFSLATKNTYGLALNAPSPLVQTLRVILKAKRLWNGVVPTFLEKNINYLDFDSAIRERSDLKKIHYNNLMDLAQRKLIDWVPIETIWNDHQCKKGNFADALIVLTSLEIHMKAQEQSQSEVRDT